MEDLAAEAAEYIKAIGLSDDEIAKLKANLSPNNPTNPETGDMGIVVVTVMGIAALMSMGALTVLKKKEF